MNYAEANALRYAVADIPLPEDIGRAEFLELLTAGVRDALFGDLQDAQDERDAVKLAALAVAEARDWAAVAKRVRDRDSARKSGMFIERRPA
ncbi:DUF2742 domain-containing protein [Gordonia sp. DT219]|uniref:DUF2742 domain-containing protein n=1 Tax=Gordonia sp. DT219 TaxID=3416658 RepID=UPI003CFA13C2